MASFDLDLRVQVSGNLSDRRRQLAVVGGTPSLASHAIPADNPLVSTDVDSAYLQTLSMASGGVNNDDFGGNITLNIRGSKDGRTIEQVDLVEDWENWIRALILTFGGRILRLPGPDFEDNPRRDTTDPYTWRIPESYRDTFYTWLQRVPRNSTINVRFDDGAQTLTGVPKAIPLVLSPSKTQPGIETRYSGRSRIDFKFDARPVIADLIHRPVGIPAQTPFLFRALAKGVADRLRISLRSAGNIALQVGEPTNYSLPKAIGGFGAITYELAPTLPDGIVFDKDQVALIGTARYILEPLRYTLVAKDELNETATVSFNLSFVSDLEPELDDFVYAYTLVIEPRGDTPEYRFCTEPVATVMDGLEYEPGVLLDVTRMIDSDGPDGPICHLAALSDEVLEAAFVGDPRIRRATVSLYQYIQDMDDWVLRKIKIGNLGEGSPQDDGTYQIEVEELDAYEDEQIPIEWSHEFQQTRAPGDMFFSELRSLSQRGQEFPWGD